MAKVCSFIPEHQSSGKTMTPPASPPHPPPRRLRVREVSSRFMSPVVSSSSSGDLHLPSSKCPIPKHTTTEIGSKTHHRSQSAHRRQLDHQQPPPEPLSCADDNRIDMMQRSLETPFLGSHSKQFPFSSSTVHKKKNASSVRVYKENGGGGGGTGKHLPRPRPDTPNVMFQGIDRRIATAPRSPTVARKLVQLSGMSMESSSSSLDCATPCTDNLVDLSASTETKSSDALDHQGICNSPTFRSSMPETDFLQTMSSRRSCDSWNVGGDSSKLSACQRSLNSAISQQNFSNASKSVFKPPAFPLKPNPNSLKSSANFLPQPSYAKVGAETSKGRKSHAEDFHTLRLLYNRYLQWRYVNARAETSMNAQLIAAQKSLHALVVKISELHDSVEKKHSELVQLKKDGIISTILENQMPYLDEWSALEGEYSSSLSEAIKALQDASLRLPVVGNVRASIAEIAGALNSASNVMDLLFLLVESFLPKGEEMDTLMSQLAVVVSRERALIEECGDLLTKTHNLQVEECSLRGQLIQLKQRIYSDQVRSNQ